MASKRMFRLDVLETDSFMEMPLSTQALYFHLNLRADDDGFIGNPKQIVRLIGASQNDLDLLIAKRFVLTFDDGVIVIKHWRMHNTLSANRYKETKFIEDKSMLKVKENKAYTFDDCGNVMDDSYLIEMSKRQIDEQKTNKRRTKDEQKTNTDIDKDIGIDKDIDTVNNNINNSKDINRNILKNSKSSLSSKLDCDNEVYKEIIDYLNQKTGKKFRWQTKSTQEKINGRIKDGFNVEDFKKVIDNKCADWKDNHKMNKFLRPETLFIPGHFESYLNETGEKDTKEWQDEQEKWFLEGSK